MSTEPVANEKRADARHLYEMEGWSHREVARRVGVHHATVSRWARAENWERHAPYRTHAPDDPTLDDARRRANLASEQARLRWASRRADEADAAGVTASLARTKIAEYIQSDKPDDARRLAIVYGVLIDKAQLLTGEMPAASPAPDPMNVGDDPAAMIRQARERTLKLLPAADAQ